MTHDDAKRLIPLLTAYAEGKTIQLWDGHADSAWEDIPNWSGGMVHGYQYRVKPTPTRRPWTYEEIIDRIGYLIRVRSDAPAENRSEVGLLCGVINYPLTVHVAGFQARMSPESLLELYECRHPGLIHAGWFRCGVEI